MQRIESRTNPRLREFGRLIASSHERRKSRRCVVEGAHLLDVYCTRHGSPESVIVVDDLASRPDLAALIAQLPPARVAAVPRALFAEIATLPPDVGILAVVDVPATAAASPEAIACSLLLDDIQDPGNVGTLIRTAAAAGVDRVVLSPGCAFAWAPKALRAGQGAQFLTAIDERVDLPRFAAQVTRSGGRVVASVPRRGCEPWRADLRGRVAMVVGNEGSGVSAALLAQAAIEVTIPMAPGSESLNAAAAAAVLLFERRRQLADTAG